MRMRSTAMRGASSTRVRRRRGPAYRRAVSCAPPIAEDARTARVYSTSPEWSPRPLGCLSERGDHSGEVLYTLAVRSEEHTSELQSHHDLVCRLLLEKKKKK